MFILCGAFVGLEKIIKQRMSPGTIGFSGEQTRSINPDSDYNELILELTPEDMIKYGLIPEFVGRLPVVVPFQRLDEDDLYEIVEAQEFVNQAI